MSLYTGLCYSSKKPLGKNKGFTFIDTNTSHRLCITRCRNVLKQLRVSMWTVADLYEKLR